MSELHTCFGFELVPFNGESCSKTYVLVKSANLLSNDSNGINPFLQPLKLKIWIRRIDSPKWIRLCLCFVSANWWSLIVMYAVRYWVWWRPGPWCTAAPSRAEEKAGHPRRTVASLTEVLPGMDGLHCWGWVTSSGEQALHTHTHTLYSLPVVWFLRKWEMKKN